MRQQEPSGRAPGEPGGGGGAALLPQPVAESWGAEELAATLDSVGAGVWAVDLDGRCAFVNRAACQILGYSRDECLGRTLQCPRPDCRIRNAMETGTAASVEDDLLRRCDGAAFGARYSIQPVIVQGRRKGTVITFADITARKHAEKALRKTDEWLRFAQKVAGFGIFDLDLKTGQARVSEGLYQLYGLEPGTPRAASACLAGREPARVASASDPRC